MMNSWFGLLLGAGVIAFGAAETGNIQLFFNFHGLFIVLGGVFAATLVNSSGKELLDASRWMLDVFRPRGQEATNESLINRLVKLAQVARQHGFLGVQNEISDSDNPFLSKALEMAVVSGDAARLKATLEMKIEMERHARIEASNIFRTMAVFGPMFGLVGTIFGIVRVLQNMSSPESVGPSMALALTSALSGIVSPNLLCVPIANRIRSQALDNLTEQELILVAVIGMATNLSPALLETELRMIYAHPEALFVPGKVIEVPTQA